MPVREGPRVPALGHAAVDHDGRILSHDEIFAELMGRAGASLIGVALASLLSPPNAVRLSFSRTPYGTELVAENMSDRRRAEQRLAAQHRVARILAEAETIAEASPRILRAICESLETDVGGLWILDRAAGCLRSVEGWVARGIEAPKFMAATRAMRPQPGVGLPGHVWQTASAVWIEDLPSSGPIYVRGPIAREEGLHGAFAFPILLGSEVLGVMDFFCREVRQPDADVLEMLSTFGSQIGQFMERKRIEEALRSSERQLQAIIDNSPSCIYVTDHEGRILLLNRRTEAVLRMSNEEARGRLLEDILTPAIAESVRGPQGARVLEREEVINFADGPHTFLTHRFLLPELGGRPYAVCGISTDITEIKRAEEDLRHLAAELSAAEDRERRRLARDLHDSIGQTLSALKMDLARAEMSGALSVVDELIGQIRTMTFDLYPAMLDDLGLVPTLHTYLAQFTQRTNIRGSITEIGAREPLVGAVRNYLFRAIKELLNNVAKHARATEALISVHWRRGAVRVSVTDDGAGFDPQLALEPRTRRGLGLADIRERVRAMGGQLMIDASPQSGSHVVLEVPLRGGRAEAEL